MAVGYEKRPQTIEVQMSRHYCYTFKICREYSLWINALTTQKISITGGRNMLIFTLFHCKTVNLNYLFCPSLRENVFL